MTVIPLAANQPPGRFYRGGARIDRFRGTGASTPNTPEDWIASVTTVAGESSLGLSILPSGLRLADAVAADPLAWLGRAHIEAFGDATMVLVKLLDAGQRLPVHAHPDDAFSRAHLHVPFGKAEAWYILEPGNVHLGLREDIERDRLRALVQTQDTAALISLLHTRKVGAGDVVYVPPGELHAIGEGILLLELQQPSDLSILLEWDDFAIDGARLGHLGLGFDVALEAVRTTARTTEEIDALIGPASEGSSILPPPSEKYFRLERRVVGGSVVLDPGFAVLVVEDGDVQVEPQTGTALTLARGTTAVVPHAAGALTLGGRGTVLVCRPPAAQTAME